MAGDTPQWHVHTEGGGTVGPVSWKRVVEGIRSGKVPMDAFLRRKGDEWRRVDSYPQLAKLDPENKKTSKSKSKSTPDTKRVLFESKLELEHARIHAAAIYCSDGRWGEQMDDFMQNGLGLPRYDRLAIPGGSACLSGNLTAFLAGRDAEEHLAFLINVHELERIVLIAHESCAYYLKTLKTPEDKLDTQQRADLAAAARRIALLRTELSVETYVARASGNGVAFLRVERD